MPILVAYMDAYDTEKNICSLIHYAPQVSQLFIVRLYPLY